MASEVAQLNHSNNADPPRPLESRAARTIREVFESGRPLTYVRSPEEQRVATVLKEVSRTLSASRPLPIWTWSLTEGMRDAAGEVRSRYRNAARRARLHRRAPGRRHLPPQGLPRTAARIR